jgi:hypothetical protein
MLQAILKDDSANMKRQTEKPTAHLAHLVLPDTQANPSQNQKSQFCQRTNYNHWVKKT